MQSLNFATSSAFSTRIKSTMGPLRRLAKKRVWAFLLFCGLCYVIIFEYQYINKYQEKQEQLLETKSLNQIWKVTKQTDGIPVYNETFLEKIRRMFIETKSYVKIDTEIKNTTKAVPIGVGRKIAEIFGNKTEGSYFEIGIGQDEEDQMITWLENEMRWTGFVLEPNIQAYNLNSGQRSRAKFFLKCVMVFDKEWHHSKGITSRDNNCFPLEAILQALFRDSSNRPDLLVINSDGYEDAILNTLDFRSMKVEVVVLSLRGALKDTTSFHLMMEKKGYKGRLISNNHSTGKTYIVFEKLKTV